MYTQDVIAHREFESWIADYRGGKMTAAAITAVMTAGHGYRLNEKQEEVLETAVLELVREAANPWMTPEIVIARYCDALALAKTM
jgi:hypothetical protein